MKSSFREMVGFGYRGSLVCVCTLRTLPGLSYCVSLPAGRICTSLRTSCRFEKKKKMKSCSVSDYTTLSCSGPSLDDGRLFRQNLRSSKELHLEVHYTRNEVGTVRLINKNTTRLVDLLLVMLCYWRGMMC